MPIALVKIHHHRVNDNRFGKLDYIENIIITTIDKNFDTMERNFDFPKFADPSHCTHLYNNNTIAKSSIATSTTDLTLNPDFNRACANKIFNNVSQLVTANLKQSSVIFVTSSRDRELVQDFITDIPIQIMK